MNEREEAVILANRLLDKSNCDPDDDLRVLARQLLRRHDEINRLQADNEILTLALQEIEAGDLNPCLTATEALDNPSHKMLFG